MDVVNAEQARIAEEAGACAVMALERVPADIRKDGNSPTYALEELTRSWLIINSAVVWFGLVRSVL
jgi:pyridoxal biosynthesis lyase PdxS